MSEKKIVSIEDRIPKLKQARKKKANRRLIFYLSIFFFLIFIIVYLQSPLSHVRTIEITGNNNITDEEIIKWSEVNVKTNIWMIDLELTERNLLENPVIHKAEVSRDLPSTIRIQVEEHKVVGYLKRDNLYYPVLGNGVVLDDASQKEYSGNSPLLHQFTDEDVLHRMAAELNKLPETITSLISEIYWLPEEDNPNRILLYMVDGYIVDAAIRDFSEKMEVYPSIVAQLDPEVEGIIHLGVGVYFEALTEEENSGSEDTEINASTE